MKYSFKWIPTILIIGISLLTFTACDESKPTSESIVSSTQPSTAVLQNTPLNDAVIPEKITATIPSLTTLPIPKLFVLDVTSKGNAPADLLDFMFDYSGSAGGWGCTINGAPAWDTPLNGKVVAAIPQTLVWFAINLPGDADGQTLLTLPDGAVLPLELFIRSEGCFKVQYEISPGALLGTYSIKYQQDEIQLIDSFSLEMPGDPIQGIYQGNEWFSGFDPNEKVSLTIYYRNDINEFRRPELAALFKELPDFTAFFNSNNFGSYNFLAYLDQQLVTSDENGSFLIGFTSDQLNSLDQFWKTRLRIVARGESSGMAADSNAQRLAGSCNDSPPSQLSIGNTARVTNYGNPLGPYSSKTVAEGTLMTLILGPICENHGDFGWAWIANTSDETDLWVYENNPGGYFLEPAETIMAGQTNADQSSPTPSVEHDCPGAEPQRVIIGDSIRVCTKSDRLTVREQPSLDSTIQIRIYPGTIAQVIEGPSCADNSSWWKVKVAAGTKVFRTSDYILDADQEGWVREGSDEVDKYFICPILK